jgi:hypothetical protein
MRLYYFGVCEIETWMCNWIKVEIID